MFEPAAALEPGYSSPTQRRVPEHLACGAEHAFGGSCDSEQHIVRPARARELQPDRQPLGSLPTGRVIDGKSQKFMSIRLRPIAIVRLRIAFFQGLDLLGRAVL